MSQSLVVGFARASILAIASGALYWRWLTTPVLDYWSLNEWRAVAIVLAACLGAIGGLRKLSLASIGCGVALGMIACGTWLDWYHNDVRISVGYALRSHLGMFWREVSMLALAAVAGGLCTARLIRSRVQHD